jgi:rhamnosyltransferase
MKGSLNTRVSVVIPIYNGGKQFRDTMESVLKQKTPFEYEVILIDSSSTDGTAEYAKAEAEKSSNVKFFQIRKEEFQHGRTRNMGIKEASGKYVALLTQDAKPYNEHWLARLVEPMMVNETVVAVFGKHIPYSDADIFEKRIIQKHFDQYGEGMVLFSLNNDNRKKFAEDPSYRGYLCYYSDNNSALRKETWEEIPYPEVKFAEDQLWAKEIITKGYTKAYNSEAAVYHSHRFDFTGYLRRFREEGEALHMIHEWKICNYFIQLPWHMLYFVKNDLKEIDTYKLSFSEKIYWVGYSFMKNTAKAIGLYQGYKESVKNKR